MSKKLDILNCQGARVGEYVLPDEIIELEKGEQAVHDVIVAFMAGQRAGTASTKTRGLVSGGGAKPFRQKELGRARAGSSRSPVWVGGIIIAPVISEKSQVLATQGKYVFKVDPKSEKIEIGRAVEQLFNVKVKSVNVINVAGKAKRMGRSVKMGRRPDWKKAIVTLQEGSIELF